MPTITLKAVQTYALPQSLSGDDIMANILGMRPQLQARGNEIEELRRIPDDIVAQMRSAGLFRMMMPAQWGGPQMNPMQVNAALEELAVGNAAVAWCAMIQMDSGLYSAYLEENCAHDMFGTLDCALSNVLRTAGKARRVDGGYLVDGRWPFASGSLHCDWFGGGCLVYGDDPEHPETDANGAPVARVILARREDFIIHDTWHTTGLRGTGSNDIEARALFIPFERSFNFDDTPRAGALYSWPAMLSAKMPGVVLGIARSAIDTVVHTLRGKPGILPHVALAVADAQTQYAAARAYVHGSLEAVWARLCANQQPDEQERVAVVLARTNAFQASRAAVQMMYDAMGAASVYGRTSVLDRHLRDVNTACQHLMAQRRGQHAAGALMLQAEAPPYPFL